MTVGSSLTGTSLRQLDSEPTPVAWSADSLARTLSQPSPTTEQRAVIEAPMRAGLVLAGAGSGKTETMAGRVVYLIANGLVAPDQVLGLTFTRKAAGELAERIRHRLARLAAVGRLEPDIAAALEIGQPRVSTYNSYAAGIVAEHGPRIGAEPGADAIGQAMSWGHAASLVEDYAGDMSGVVFAASTVTIDVLALASAMAEHEVSPERLREFTAALTARIEALPRLRATTTADQVYDKVRKMLDRQLVRLRLLPLVEAYTARKHSAGVIDYADQVSLAARIAGRSPVVGALERQRYAAVLLDEFQDTSYGQLELMSRLFGGHPVMAVGDPSQAIYGWRGASTGNMREFSRRFRADADSARSALSGESTGPATEAVFPLSVSWRNGAGILGIANDIAKLCADEHLPVVELTPAPARTDPGEICCALLESQIDEVSWLADQIEHRWGTRSPGQSFAVLSRARALLRPIAAELRQRNVPVEVLGLGGLIDEPEVADVVATLRVISDPMSGDAIGRLLVGPRWRIGARDLMALGHRGRSLSRQAKPAADPIPGHRGSTQEETGSLIEALDDLGAASDYSVEGYRRLRELNTELTGLRRRSGVSLADLIDDVIVTLGLAIEVAVRPAVTHSRAQAHLHALHEVAEEFTRIAEVPSLAAFLSYLAAAEDEERGLEPGEVETSSEAVSLLTVHAAKGLEWDVVAIPGLTKDVFPQNVTARTEHWLTDPGHLPVTLCGDRRYLPDLDLSGVTDQKAAEVAYLQAKQDYQAAAGIEEMRLAYVAVTRARGTLLCSGSWWTPAVTTVRGPSSVLELVRGHALAAPDGDCAVSAWADPPDERATNPMSDHFPQLLWPVDPLPPARRVARETAATLVLEPPDDPMTLESLAWDAEVDLLLAERDRHRAGTIDVVAPVQLSVSELVALQRDPDSLARRIRRPLPSAPAPLARRGTAFHAWLEQRFGATRLVDLDDLPGSADEGAATDDQLAELKAAFLAGDWAGREPTEVEVPFHVRVGEGLSLRGRMDAVFGDVTTGYEVVDWKTGAPPSGAEKKAVAIQLAAYRLAWASLAGVEVEQVSAAFVYVRQNETVRPADLATAAELLTQVSNLPAWEEL